MENLGKLKESLLHRTIRPWQCRHAAAGNVFLQAIKVVKTGDVKRVVHTSSGERARPPNASSAEDSRRPAQVVKIEGTVDNTMSEVTLAGGHVDITPDRPMHGRPRHSLEALE